MPVQYFFCRGVNDLCLIASIKQQIKTLVNITFFLLRVFCGGRWCWCVIGNSANVARVGSVVACIVACIVAVCVCVCVLVRGSVIGNSQMWSCGRVQLFVCCCVVLLLCAVLLCQPCQLWPLFCLRSVVVLLLFCCCSVCVLLWPVWLPCAYACACWCLVLSSATVRCGVVAVGGSAFLKKS